MTAGTTLARFGSRPESPLPVGSWRVEPARSSASFTARLAGRRVQGRLPLTGGAVVDAAIENSTAELIAFSAGVRTGHGVLDVLLAGRGFLDAETFPEIRFRSDLLVRVPTGWRAVGHLQVKGTDHPLACELDVEVRQPRPGAAELKLTTRWVIDSTWITTQPLPGLSRRVAMTCSVDMDRRDRPLHRWVG